MIFTTEQRTLAALEKASALSRDLKASVRLVVAHVVPYAYSIENPPVDLAFIKKRAVDLVLQAKPKAMPGDLPVMIDIYLCRQKSQTLLTVLKPNSLVVLGDKKRWWPAGESRIAAALRKNGHHVVCAYPIRRG